MLHARLNFPVEASFLGSLVENEADLQWMMPQAKLPFCETQWLSRLGASDTLSFYVERENVLVGHFAFLRIKRDLREATLGFVYLAPSLRKSGAARELVALAERCAKELLGLERMLLNVRSSNLPAHALYRKVGYEEYAREGDLVRMKRALG